MADGMTDPRIDPRIKQAIGPMLNMPQQPDANSRDEMVAESNTEAARQAAQGLETFLEGTDNEEVSPSKGLRIDRLEASPEGASHTVNFQYIRSDNDEVLPLVYYIHGGGMMSMSCFLGNYRAWGKIIASYGVAVLMVDFRNCLTPSSVPEIAPFPAGLNDCVFGLKWAISQADELKIDASNVIVAGESGGGNLSIATGLKLKQDGDIDLIRGIYALCPYIAGRWPQDQFPSSTENNGILINVHGNRGALAYGMEELENENPLAWPSFASKEDLAGLPPMMVSVNECDPLRDEGIVFYRALLEANVPASCRQVMGSIHATEIFPIAAPEVSRETGRSISDFAKGATRP